MPDTLAPTVNKTDFTSIFTTPDSITVTWEKATDNVTPSDRILYRVFIKEDNSPDVPLQVCSGYNLTAYTFKGLKDNTDYLVYVTAEDEAGNAIRYPGKFCSQCIKTGIYDDEAPTVKTRGFTSIYATSDTITVTWEKATDNLTPAGKIIYKVYIKEKASTEESRLVCKGTNLSSFFFKDLKSDTEYLVHVIAEDEAGNSLRYPASGASQRIKTRIIDKEDPIVSDTKFKSIVATSSTITISWEKATDNLTPADRIIYKVYICEMTYTEEAPMVYSATNISQYRFTGLKKDTDYLVHVKAVDEAGHYVRYPAKNASKKIRTATVDDNTVPYATSTAIAVTKTTPNSISIKWEEASDNLTPANKILYKVYIGEDKVVSNARLAREITGFNAYTFTGLKPDSTYYIFIIASDEQGNCLQYPAKNTLFRAHTAPDDSAAPTVKSRCFKISDILDDRFTIEWEKATDNVTPANKILYKVGLTEFGNPNDPWHIVKEAKGISSHTFTGLKPNKEYAFYVKAYDEAGNLLQYPANNSSDSIRTKEARVHSLSFSIEQGATVLYGTNTISFGIEYNYYKVNSQGNVIGHGSGSWECKWSNKKKKTGTITLPENCYFENNQVFVRIRSRRAASAGLDKWKACSSGYVDVTSGVLKFRLTGSYYYYSVRLGGSAADGYAQFK